MKGGGGEEGGEGGEFGFRQCSGYSTRCIWRSAASSGYALQNMTRAETRGDGDLRGDGGGLARMSFTRLPGWGGGGGGGEGGDAHCFLERRKRGV